MASVFDVAKYILSKNGAMSTWKLQKLCYYSQAWSLAWTGHGIFSEDFQAWSNGPVCPELFREHKGKFLIDEKELKKGCVDSLTDDERETVDIILKDYGGLEPYDLREMSHNESPWQLARGATPEGERCTELITKESMGEYYGSL